jgi:hypothetical protein
VPAYGVTEGTSALWPGEVMCVSSYRGHFGILVKDALWKRCVSSYRGHYGRDVSRRIVDTVG